MRDNPWKEVLDAIYEMGGRAEYPSGDTDGSLDPNVNLVDLIDYPLEQVERASKTLQKMGLAKNSTIRGADDEEPDRNQLTLTGEGYDFAHDRQQEIRNIRSNRSITHLTLVLAFVGMAQATALTANVSEKVTGDISMIVTLASGLILLIIYYSLYRTGVFRASDV